ncbi:MAG: glycosyltransferase family 4 protein [Halieaceae bacterium]|nr:glycosyltransferase family 4 protein [Halieaceae bacterium]
MTSVLAVGLAFVTSLLACGLYLRLAHRWQLLDVPNHRSAHSLPTPRGGGIGILLGLFVAMLLPPAMGTPWPAPYPWLALVAGGLALAGIVDDRIGLPVVLRFLLYGLACAGVTWLLLPGTAWWLLGLAAFFCLWLVNLFNFMDGIDGIAAVEAGFALLAAALLSLWLGEGGAYPLFCLLLAAATLAFLHWNWAPARLFMGDAGSIPLGFLLAALSLQGAAAGILPWVCWPILLAVFIGDATYTLAWRALHGEKITEAHSRHLYQRLARHWGSHSRVVQVMLVYNLLWLAPLAAAAAFRPGYAFLWLPLAYLPLLPALLKAGKLP